jgi:hypothetical protein
MRLSLLCSLAALPSIVTCREVYSFGEDSFQHQQRDGDIQIKVEDQSEDSVACAAALKALSIEDPKDSIFNVVFSVHRNGEVIPCGSMLPSPAAIDAALKAMDTSVCDQADLNKFQVETFLTNMFESQLAKGACGATDNETAPEGLFGFCDMGSDRTVIQPDHDEIIPTSSGSLPCRMFTREGRRIYSLHQLATLAEAAKQDVGTCSEANETSCSSGPVLDLYAIPTGRMFMFAPSYVGETFIVNHVEDHEDPIVLEVLSLNPRVFEIQNFFSMEEADALIDKALNDTDEVMGLHRSTTGATNGQVYSKRTSDNAWDTTGPESRKIQKRCFEMLGFDQFYESQADGLQVSAALHISIPSKKQGRT